MWYTREFWYSVSIVCLFPRHEAQKEKKNLGFRSWRVSLPQVKERNSGNWHLFCYLSSLHKTPLCNLPISFLSPLIPQPHPDNSLGFSNTETSAVILSIEDSKCCKRVDQGTFNTGQASHQIRSRTLYFQAPHWSYSLLWIHNNCFYCGDVQGFGVDSHAWIPCRTG